MANLFTRPDTFLGVCEAIGQDLGVHPNWLRIAAAVLVLWQPVWVIAGYCAVGLAILALRLLVPDRMAEPATEAAVVDTANDAEPVALAKAA